MLIVRKLKVQPVATLMGGATGLITLVVNVITQTL